MPPRRLPNKRMKLAKRRHPPALCSLSACSADAGAAIAGRRERRGVAEVDLPPPAPRPDPGHGGGGRRA